ncbi:hypothetical protein GQ44DRAFT_676010 [Phaeosphaeriaceae sp. PMI808]|nr:hypothetical protein GQ44DRAFT_676010 [Phaeosphaeriaceae sp. PMI808]
MGDEDLTINLKILSPSTELEGGVSLPNVPATTTIKELRSLIQDAVPSKPATERMRLIYRGRVVANDQDTLGYVFGADNIRESKDQSLHLVLRELPAPPRSSTAPPNPFRPAQGPIPASPALQTNPFRAIPQPRPNSQPQAPPLLHHHHHHHHQVPPLPNPFQVPLPPHVAQAMGQDENEQGANTQTQQSNRGGTVPDNGTPPPPPPLMGLPQLPGFGLPHLPSNGRTVRQEGTGPNGERWMVTYSNTQPQLPRQFPTPPNFFGMPPHPNAAPALNEAVDRLLPRMAHIIQSARQEMETVRMLMQANRQQDPLSALFSSSNPPPWRLERIRQHVQTMEQNLTLVERGLLLLSYDTSMTGNPDVASLRQSATDLREHIDHLNRMLGPNANAASVPASSTETSHSTPVPGSSTTTTTTSESLPAGTPQELFIISSAQGPIGILYDERGTYTTAPMVPTLPFQTFTNQFAQNRQLIAGLGQQIAQGSHQLHNQLANIQPTPTQQPGATGQDQTQNPLPAQAQQQNQAQNINPAQNQNANNPANPQGENDRVANMASHLWLLFKLACFVYFFSGAGWYRSVFLGVIAGGVYIAQLGMFEEQFNVVRQHFEAILPVGALAERVAAPRNANAQAQGQQRTESGHALTPEEAARRLLQQHQEQRFSWVRESMRTVERSFAIFLASLWPGIGERMVHAQEERIRLERVAEEERLRLEEEAKQKEEDAKQGEEQKGEVAGVQETGPGMSSSSAKGKERADAVEGGVLNESASGSSS